MGIFGNLKTFEYFMNAKTRQKLWTFSENNLLIQRPSPRALINHNIDGAVDQNWLTLTK